MEKLGTQAKQSMVRRSLIGLVIGLIYVSVILAGYYIDRVVVSVFLCIVVALSVLEVRDALGNRIPKQFNALVWIFALCFGVPYFLFGISGVAVFILAIFIIGCAISVFSQLNEAVVHLAYFSFLLIYPAFVMSAMFFINKSMDASGNLLDIHTVGLALVFSSPPAPICSRIFSEVCSADTSSCLQSAPKKPGRARQADCSEVWWEQVLFICFLKLRLRSFPPDCPCRADLK